MDIGTISLILLVGMLALLAIGMPLGFASGFLAVLVMVLKFGPDLLFSSFGTAWDPPIPATIKPLILLTLVLLALQSISNLIHDWNRDPVSHDPADDLDLPTHLDMSAGSSDRGGPKSN